MINTYTIIMGKDSLSLHWLTDAHILPVKWSLSKNKLIKIRKLLSSAAMLMASWPPFSSLKEAIELIYMLRNYQLSIKKAHLKQYQEDKGFNSGTHAIMIIVTHWSMNLLPNYHFSFYSSAFILTGISQWSQLPCTVVDQNRSNLDRT